MSLPKNHRKKWTTSEILTLQREYELLELTVPEIAQRHKRTIKSIMYKLENEGFIDSWNNARGFDMKEYQNMDFHSLSENSYSDDNISYHCIEENTSNDLNDITLNRIWSLETNIKEIGNMVREIYNSVVSPKVSSLNKYI
jgi:hypothetical protein